jgi:NAD(P)-dependent dehydrogenase (short-subunit alcohol dehydrogenase family)
MAESVRLDGKIALITGIGRGIGRTAALLFAEAGAQVVGCDLDPEGCAQTAQLAKAAGTPIHAMAGVDLGDAAQAAAWVTEAAAVHGGIDVLYNNASTQRFGPITELTADDWDFTMRNELNLVFYVTKAAWPHLVQRGGGSVLNIGSIAGIRGVEFTPQNAHATAKGGVISLTRQLVVEGGPHGIRANVISPGIVETDNTRQFLREPAPDTEAMLRRIPLGRPGRPEDIVHAALFLSSDLAGWVTGAHLVIDGGASVLG